MGSTPWCRSGPASSRWCTSRSHDASRPHPHPDRAPGDGGLRRRRLRPAGVLQDPGGGRRLTQRAAPSFTEVPAARHHVPGPGRIDLPAPGRALPADCDRPLAGPQSRARAWTEPYFWTGGDVQPVPLRSGSLLYTKFDISDQTNQPYSRIWLTTRAGAVGKALTLPQDNCAQPALSPDETML